MYKKVLLSDVNPGYVDVTGRVLFLTQAACDTPSYKNLSKDMQQYSKILTNELRSFC